MVDKKNLGQIFYFLSCGPRDAGPKLIQIRQQRVALSWAKFTEIGG